MCGIWTLAGCPLSSSCFGTSKAALNFSRTNDSGGTRSLTLSPSNQEQRQLLFPSYNYL